MKKTFKIKSAALLLVTVMLLGLLSSCGKTKPAVEYKGKTISENIYSYWMSDIKTSYCGRSNDNDEFWNKTYSNGRTAEQYINDIFEMRVKSSLICLYLFDEYKLSLDDNTKSEMESALNDLLMSYSSESELNAVLSKYNMNFDLLKEEYEISEKVARVFEYLYSEGGPRAISDEALDAYYKANYTRGEIIIIYTTKAYETDENGEYTVDATTGSYKIKELSKEETAKKVALGDEIIRRLDAGEDFAALSSEYNEDPLRDKFSDGYCMSSNEVQSYGSELVLALRDLEEGEYTKLQVGAQIYIVRRAPLKDRAYADSVYKEQFTMMSESCENADFDSYMRSFFDDIKVYEDNISEYSLRNAPFINMG